MAMTKNTATSATPQEPDSTTQVRRCGIAAPTALASEVIAHCRSKKSGKNAEMEDGKTSKDEGTGGERKEVGCGEDAYAGGDKTEDAGPTEKDWALHEITAAAAIATSSSRDEIESQLTEKTQRTSPASTPPSHGILPPPQPTPTPSSPLTPPRNEIPSTPLCLRPHTCHPILPLPPPPGNPQTQSLPRREPGPAHLQLHPARLQLCRLFS